MALPTKPLQTAIDYARAFFRTSFVGFAMGVKQFFGQSSRAVGLNVWGLQKTVESLDKDIVPSPSSSSDALSDWAVRLGLPDGAGGYGRLKPTAASGGASTLTGVQGTVFPDGRIATADDGSTQIAVSGAVTIPGSGGGTGSVAAVFVAVTKGTAGNLPIGTVCTWQSPPAGADPTFVLTGALSKGTDTESNPDVYARIVTRLQAPPRGGNSTDIEEWAQSVSGIVGVYCYPRRSGTGTVDVMVTSGGSGQSRVPSSAAQTLAQAAIDGSPSAPARVPGAESITVGLPYAPNGRGHLARTRVVVNGAVNAFDWGSDAPGTAYLVDAGGYAAGPPATLRLTGLAPQSLKTAINNYIVGAAVKPRLQVLSTGSVINKAIGVVAWADGGGKTTLTLETLPSGWVAPTAGDTVYPYGPVVATIAAGILALCDALGPSRASGYGDTINTWNDTLFINQLVRVAEDAVDSNGVALITEVVAGGATIDGVAADVQGADNTASSPELLYLSHVAVTA
jgi:hypothetical protein